MLIGAATNSIIIIKNVSLVCVEAPTPRGQHVICIFIYCKLHVDASSLDTFLATLFQDLQFQSAQTCRLKVWMRFQRWIWQVCTKLRCSTSTAGQLLVIKHSFICLFFFWSGLYNDPVSETLLERRTFVLQKQHQSQHDFRWPSGEKDLGAGHVLCPLQEVLHA